MLILYATETGTAEDVAFKVHSLAIRRVPFANVRISRIDEFDIQSLPNEPLVIFITSTAGDGEVPSTMKTFWSFLLRKSLSPESLRAVEFCVFGLGDSSYDKFNAAARRLSVRLKQLGAQEIIPLGLGDDQARYGYFTALDKWLADLWKALSDRGLISNAVIDDSPILKAPLYQVTYTLPSPIQATPSTIIDQSSLPTPPCNDDIKDKSTISNIPLCRNSLLKEEVSSLSISSPGVDVKTCRGPFNVIVSQNNRMTKAGWKQDVRHIILSLPPSTFPSVNPSSPPYIAGDVVVVQPRNSHTLVSRAFEIIKEGELKADPNLNNFDLAVLGVNVKRCLDDQISAHGSRRNRVGDLQCSLELLLSTYLDIGGVPSRSFFEQLSLFATDIDEKQKLLEIASAEGTDLYYDYCVKERRNFVEVLEDFRSSRPTLNRLLEMIPCLSPRHYSIASSGIVDPHSIHICVALVEFKTPYGRLRQGICSQYFATLSPGDSVNIWLRPGSFSAPPVEVPAILVGPGTGVAPMRAIIQERLFLSIKNGKIDNEKEGETCLFFGCRRQDSDYLFHEEWRALDTSQTCSNVSIITAFSQEKTSKVYVTHKMKEHGELVWKAIEKGGYIIIAGSAKKMPTDVRKAFCEIISEHGRMSQSDAEKFLLSLERSKKYLVEAWS